MGSDEAMALHSTFADNRTKMNVLFLLFISSLYWSGVSACASCYRASSPFHVATGPPQNSWQLPVEPSGQRSDSQHWFFTSANRAPAKVPFVLLKTNDELIQVNTRHLDESDETIIGEDETVLNKNREGEESQGTEDDETKDDFLSVAMIWTLGAYKNVISPLLPPACRFVPTCSQYGVQAIKDFGPTKGVILIAWRLVRCSPIGGKGYDPPIWPPVLFNHGSY
jgi:putative membrane protein insertion efficiency factor